VDRITARGRPRCTCTRSATWRQIRTHSRALGEGETTLRERKFRSAAHQRSPSSASPSRLADREWIADQPRGRNSATHGRGICLPHSGRKARALGPRDRPLSSPSPVPRRRCRHLPSRALFPAGQRGCGRRLAEIYGGINSSVADVLL